MTNLTEILVPDVGEFENIPVIEILVGPGDVVQAEDSLITLESDKASLDVPSPSAGRIKDLKVKLGDLVSQGSLILTMEVTAEKPDREPPAAPPTAVQESESESESESTLQSRPESTPLLSERKSTTSSSTADPRAPKGSPSPSPTAALAATDNTQRRLSHATPALRRYARELGVELERVTGTGRKGRVLHDDINRYVKGALSKPETQTVESGIPSIPAVDFAKFGPVESRPLSRIQRISGPHLHRSWLNVPHVTHHDEADITDLETFRQSIKDKATKHGTRVTALTFIVKALAQALVQFPTFNASLSADGASLVLKHYFHIGIAVDTPSGLMVPVLRDVNQKGIMALALEMGELSVKARDGNLKSAELQGGCISISSLGGIGGTSFTPIINAPEVAILGVSRARMTPVWNGTDFVPRLLLPLDLSYDHRVIDGAEAARFAVYLCTLLGDLRHLLL